jgi:L-ascorbate metabolism protein UlaG (beta-lactamase superfamily)
MTELVVTRIVNACVLLEFGRDAVLTDPYFVRHWFLRLREPVGLNVEQLPRLAAIIGGHGVLDHWQPGSLAAYPFKAQTPVFVATPSMAKKAKAAGFDQVEVLPWHATRRISERLSLEVVPAQTAARMLVNSYVLSSTDGLRAFVGTEARDLDPLGSYRTQKGKVDLALLPIDGSALAGHKLVMGAADAIEAGRILGAQTLIPIHYALKPLPPLFRTHGSIEELTHLAREVKDLDIVPLPPGQRYLWGGRRV